jgi:hypothetical protein
MKVEIESERGRLDTAKVAVDGFEMPIRSLNISMKVGERNLVTMEGFTTHFSAAPMDCDLRLILIDPGTGDKKVYYVKSIERVDG